MISENKNAIISKYLFGGINTFELGLALMKHYVYILKSLKAKRYYIGYTIDLARREIEHNKGNTKSTKPWVPWKMIYYEVYKNKNDAYKREWHLKHPKGYKEKLEIIERYGRVA